MKKVANKTEQQATEITARIERTADTVTVTLHEPLVYTVSSSEGSRTLEKLTMPTRIKGKHLMATDQAQGEMGKALALLAKLAGVPRHAAHELSSKDIDLCMEAIEPYLPAQKRISNDSE